MTYVLTEVSKKEHKQSMLVLLFELRSIICVMDTGRGDNCPAWGSV